MSGPDLGYGSHVAILAAAIMRTTGSVLECGAGDWSTPVVHYTAGSRDVVTADIEGGWLDRVVAYGGGNGSHRFYDVRTRLMPGEPRSVTKDIEAWVAFIRSLNEYWGIAFVDCSPGEARVPIIEALQGRADLIVAHDTEADIPPSGGNYGWKKLEGRFKYISTCKRFRPWTTVYSDKTPFELAECDR